MSVESAQVDIKDSPGKVKRKIEKYLVKQKMTKASFARIVGISSNALGRFLGQDDPRGDNQTYEAAYLYQGPCLLMIYAISVTPHANHKAT